MNCFLFILIWVPVGCSAAIVLMQLLHFVIKCVCVCICIGVCVCVCPCLPPRWPSSKGIRLESSRPGIWFLLAPGFFPGRVNTSDLKIGTPVATQPGTWHCRVSVGTGWPGVSMLWLGEIESLVCNFCLSVAAHKNCLSRSVPEIHQYVTGASSNQPTNKCSCLHVYGCVRAVRE